MITQYLEALDPTSSRSALEANIRDAAAQQSRYKRYGWVIDYQQSRCMTLLFRYALQIRARDSNID